MISVVRALARVMVLVEKVIVARVHVKPHVNLCVAHARVVLEIALAHAIHIAPNLVQVIVALAVKVLVQLYAAPHVLVNANMAVKLRAWDALYNAEVLAAAHAVHVWDLVPLHAITIALFCANPNVLAVRHHANMRAAVDAILHVD